MQNWSEKLHFWSDVNTSGRIDGIINVYTKSKFTLVPNNIMLDIGQIDGLFKAPQSAIVLGNPQDVSVHFPSTQFPRTAGTIPGIGFWQKRGDVKRIKMPFVE